jgi:hypothetical protein
MLWLTEADYDFGVVLGKNRSKRRIPRLKPGESGRNQNLEQLLKRKPRLKSKTTVGHKPDLRMMRCHTFAQKSGGFSLFHVVDGCDRSKVQNKVSLLANRPKPLNSAATPFKPKFAHSCKSRLGTATKRVTDTSIGHKTADNPADATAAADQTNCNQLQLS